VKRIYDTSFVLSENAPCATIAQVIALAKENIQSG
jgi:hypothetical protein